MSAPAANTSSEPAITMHRTSPSVSKRSTWAARSSISSGERAFLASGRFSVQTATWSSIRVSTSGAIAASGGRRRHRVDPSRVAADDQLLDLRGALVQGRDAGVAQVALDRVVVDVARAPVDLDRQVGGLNRRLG